MKVAFEMNPDSDQNRLQRLERKVDNLTWLLSLQTMLLSALAVAYLLQLSGYLFLVMVVTIPVLIVFRRSLQACGRRLGTLWRWWDRRRVNVSEPPT